MPMAPATLFTPQPMSSTRGLRDSTDVSTIVCVPLMQFCSPRRGEFLPYAFPYYSGACCGLWSQLSIKSVCHCEYQAVADEFIIPHIIPADFIRENAAFQVVDHHSLSFVDFVRTEI